LQEIQDTGKPIEAIMITHPHPDHYFGTSILSNGTSNIPIYSTQATFDTIKNDPSHLIELAKQLMGGLLGNIGSAQMEREVRKRVVKVVQEQQKQMEDQTGGFSERLIENDMKEYIKMIIDDRKRSIIGSRGNSGSNTERQ
jgi:metal-dependent hydrolase (beta-lactamase superfamily II)